MTPDRIAQLNEQQRLCLRLVYAHLTSKEIAPHIGMEPASVDQLIKSAVRVLGVGDRRAAAQTLAEYEKRDHLAPESLGFAVAPTQTAPPARGLGLPLSIGGGPDEVGWRRRLGWIAAIAIGMAIGFGVLVSALEVLTRLLRD